MRSLDSSSAIASLPPQLRMQLLVAMNMRTLSNVRVVFDRCNTCTCTCHALHNVKTLLRSYDLIVQYEYSDIGV